MVYIFDIILFIVCAFNIAYLLFFAISAFFYKKSTYAVDASNKLKVAVLIPAYKEDVVIEECVKSCLAQEYDKTLYDIVVISDQMEVQTNQKLEALGVKVVVANYINSTKTKALNLAFSVLPDNYYDIALILDADNVIPVLYLEQLCKRFNRGKYCAIQTHRVAKNTENNLAYLDAMSEEINNTIFRKGHIALGISSALIGSGMAFDYDLIKNNLNQMKAIGGFDRELEFRLFKQGLKIAYMDELLVYDEKITSYDGFSNQRKRWVSAQVHYLRYFILDLARELLKGNVDFCDKLFQHFFLPRVLLVGFTTIFTMIITFVDINLAVKWWFLFGTMTICICVSIPRNLYTRKLLKALFSIPKTFGIMLLNIFKLKGANKYFIHTSHGK